MTFALFFAIGALCSWQLCNSIRRLVCRTPLRWIDWASALVFVAAILLVSLP